MKTCTKCNTEKPETQFSSQAKGHGGLRASCKACDSIYQAAQHAANPEKAKARNVKWKAANPGRMKELQDRWNAENPGRVKATTAAWAKDHPEARRICEQNRRARKHANGGLLSAGLADKLLKLQRGKCACCRVSIADGSHLDHRIPLALGGPNEDWNMQLLCAPCNLSKGAKHPVDFMQQRGFLL